MRDYLENANWSTSNKFCKPITDEMILTESSSKGSLCFFLNTDSI